MGRIFSVLYPFFTGQTFTPVFSSVYKLPGTILVLCHHFAFFDFKTRLLDARMLGSIKCVVNKTLDLRSKKTVNFGKI